MNSGDDYSRFSDDSDHMVPPDAPFNGHSSDGINIRPVPRIVVQGFCLSDETGRTMEAAAEDRRMTKAHVKVKPGGIPAAIEMYRQSPTPNVIVVETHGRDNELLVQLDELAEYCDAGTKVIILGNTNDVALYRELIGRGVSEYLVTPVSIYEFIGAISSLYGDPEAEPLGRIISFFGVKGGCGASTIAHNGAWALARDLENEVIVADLDLPFGTAGLDYNQDPIQGVYEAVSSPERLDETYLDRILSKCTDHLSLLAAPATLERTYDYSEKSFEQLIETMRASAPSIVLDVPHGWNGWVKETVVNSDEVVLVAEPDLANLRNAKNLVDTLRQMRPNDRAPHLVINKSNVPKRPEIRPDEFANALGLEVQCVIPFEPHLFGTAANNGQMISELEAKHAISGMFADLAHVISGKAVPARQRRGGLGDLLAKLKRKSA